MAKKSYPTDVLQQARTVSDAWSQINAEMAFGSLTVPTLTNDIAQATSIEDQITSLETQLTSLRNQRDESYQGIWETVKRVRSDVKAI